jgi:hypothetical protein
MPSDGKRSCAVSAILSVAVLFVFGLVFAYPIAWWWGMHEVYTSKVHEFEFHGRVVDSHDKPIANVTVGAKLSTYSIFSGNRDRKFVLSTDRDGRFSIGPRKGISLTLHPIEKSGYEVRGRKWPKDGWEYWPFNFFSSSSDGLIATRAEPFTFVMDATNGP